MIEVTSTEKQAISLGLGPVALVDPSTVAPPSGGEVSEVTGSNNEYAVDVSGDLHTTFGDYHDDILLISKSEKTVSSRAGHGLMESNPYANARYAQAKRRTDDMMNILRKGDVDAFGEMLESEALTLHALMMSSAPSYLLVRPNTLAAIERIREFRRVKKVPLYFTLDAGPNLHLLYPDSVAKDAKSFIRSELLPFCEGNMYLADRVGSGPEKLPVSDSTAPT